jgi:hypothetical protein
MKGNQKLKKGFLVIFTEDQLDAIKAFANRMDMSTSAFIRQSCHRNLQVLEHIDSPAIRKQFRASYQHRQ